MPKLLLTMFVLLLVLLAIPEIGHAQCTMCKSAVESNQENVAGLGEGLNTGILYLMAIPYVLFAGIVTAIIWSVRKKRKVHQS